MRRLVAQVLVLLVAGLSLVSAAEHAAGSPLAAPTPRFLAAPSFDVGGYANGVTGGDFNGDGGLDLAIPDGTFVRILLGNGDGTFGTPVSYQAGIGPYGVAVGDFDGIGGLDLAVYNIDSYDISILLNNGDGTFGPPASYGSPEALDQPVVADFNGDGSPDMAARGVQNVLVLLNLGDGTFGPVTPYLVGPSLVSIAAGDFDGDTAPDIAAVRQSPGRMVILTNAGDGTFTKTAMYGAGTFPGNLIAPDLTGDANADLAYIEFSTYDVGVMLNDGTGIFGGPVTYPIGAHAYSLDAADIVDGGGSDLALATGGFTILLNQGGGVFGSAVQSGSGAGAVDAVVSDLTGDSVQDVIVVSNIRGAALLVGRGDGTFWSAPTFDTAAGPSAMAVGRFNADRKDDLAVVANYDENIDGVVSVLLGVGQDQFVPAADVPVGVNPQDVAVGEFNADGNADLAVTNGQNDVDNLSILLGNGDGTFSSGVILSIPNFPSSIVRRDLNADGVQDLALAMFHSGIGHGQVSILLGIGDGTFGEPVTYDGASGDPTGMVGADFNHDGRADLALVSASTMGLDSSVLSLFLGNGNGTFGAAKNTNLTFSSAGIAAADLNADIRQDVVIADTDGSQVAVLLGLGNGSFGAATEYSAGTRAEGVAVGDVNRDTLIDVVLSSRYGNVSLLAGEGDGSLDPPVSYANGSGGGPATFDRVLLGRFDRSPGLDIAVSQWETNDVAILRQLPPASPRRGEK